MFSTFQKFCPSNVISAVFPVALSVSSTSALNLLKAARMLSAFWAALHAAFTWTVTSLTTLVGGGPLNRMTWTFIGPLLVGLAARELVLRECRGGRRQRYGQQRGRREEPPESGRGSVVVGGHGFLLRVRGGRRGDLPPSSRSPARGRCRSPALDLREDCRRGVLQPSYSMGRVTTRSGRERRRQARLGHPIDLDCAAGRAYTPRRIRDRDVSPPGFFGGCPRNARWNQAGAVSPAAQEASAMRVRTVFGCVLLLPCSRWLAAPALAGHPPTASPATPACSLRTASPRT